MFGVRPNYPLLRPTNKETDMSVTVQWNHDGAGPPNEFKVESQTGAGAWTPLATVPYVAGTSAYSTVDASPAHGRKYRVSAVNATGASVAVESNVPELPPSPPTDVTATWT